MEKYLRKMLMLVIPEERVYKLFLLIQLSNSLYMTTDCFYNENPR